MRKAFSCLYLMAVFAMLAVVLVALGAVPVHAQREGVEIVQELRGTDSAPLRGIQPEPQKGGPLVVIPRGLIRPEPPEPQGADGALQTTQGPAVATTPGIGMDGLGVGFTGFTVTAAPPDTNLAVGATQVVQWVNLSFAVFDKATGSPLWGPVPGNTVWAGMTYAGTTTPHPCSQTNDGDPIVLYDKFADNATGPKGRWLMAQLSYSLGPPYYLCVAVSHDSDATGTFTRYALEFASLFPDYPKLSVWPDSQNNAYYVSFNMFAPPFYFFSGAQVWALDRSAMLAAQDASAVGWQLSSLYGGLLPSDVDGSTLPPDGSPNYFFNFGTNSLNLWKFHVDFTTPGNSTLSGPNSIPVASFNAACGSSCVPQPGTSQKLDALGDRLMYRLAYRNFGGHESLVVNHSVSISTGRRTSKIGVRWYEIRNPGGTPAVYQQGTFSPDSDNRWMGSIAMDQAGNIALGYSVSSSSTYPSIRYTGRSPSDPLGSMQLESSIVAGTGSQLSNLNRWGDYSAMSIDPVNDCTFWYTTEYLKSSGTFNWSTRIASFQFPSCGGTVSKPAAPTLLSATAGDSQVSLTWSASTGATSYNVYRGESSGSESQIATGVSSTSFNNTGLVNGTTYYYVVTAVNSAGESGDSNELWATPQALGIPAAPTNLAATSGPGKKQIKLSWNGSSGASSYNVYRGEGSGSESQIATGVSSTSYTSTGLISGTTYYYLVTAVNSSGESIFSNEASAPAK